MTSGYAEETLVDKLSKLTNTQQSIQTLSRWVMFHRKRSAQSVQVWDREIYAAPKERKLVFLYLANDIMQISRKKGGEFIKQFTKVIPGAVMHVFREGDTEDKKALQRLVGIWEERKVFAPEFVDGIRKSMDGAASTEQIRSAVPQELLTPPKGVASTSSKFDAVFTLLRDVEALEVKLALVLEKISVINPALMSGDALKTCTNQQDVTELAIELEEDIGVMGSYKQTLQDDLALRTNLLAVLREYIGIQEREMMNSQQHLHDVTNRLADTELLKVDLKALYDSFSQTGQPYPPEGTASPSRSPQMHAVAQTHTQPPAPPPHMPATALLPTPSLNKRQFGEEDPSIAKKAKMGNTYNSSPQAPPPPPLNILHQPHPHPQPPVPQAQQQPQPPPPQQQAPLLSNMAYQPPHVIQHTDYINSHPHHLPPVHANSHPYAINHNNVNGAPQQQQGGGGPAQMWGGVPPMHQYRT